MSKQKSMARNHTIPDRIVSLSQPWLRPIVRGKAKASVEFGTKLDISVVNGWTRLEVYNFDAYNEAGGLAEMIERYHARTKHYPSRVIADKIYRNRSNIAYCKERGIRLSDPALGRPPKDVQPDKKQNHIDECERVEVERRFSLVKRVCGLGLITARLKETARHCIAMSILVQLIGIAVFNEKIGVCSVDIKIAVCLDVEHLYAEALGASGTGGPVYISSKPSQRRKSSAVTYLLPNQDNLHAA